MTQAQGSAAGTVERPEVFFGPRAAPLPIKVLLADDHPLMLASLRRRLEGQDGVEVVGVAQSAAELLALTRARRPDIVLTDLRMPGADGCELIASLRTACPQAKIVVLSACDDQASVDAAMLAGASAFIVKSTAPTDVTSVLRRVHDGEASLRPGLLGTGGVTAAACRNDGAELTDRERTILSAVASGKPTSAISRELWVSDHTIKFHLTNICRKVGAPNRDAAVRYAVEHGLVA